MKTWSGTHKLLAPSILRAMRDSNQPIIPLRQTHQGQLTTLEYVVKGHTVPLELMQDLLCDRYIRSVLYFAEPGVPTVTYSITKAGLETLGVNEIIANAKRSDARSAAFARAYGSDDACDEDFALRA